MKHKFVRLELGLRLNLFSELESIMYKIGTKRNGGQLKNLNLELLKTKLNKEKVRSYIKTSLDYIYQSRIRCSGVAVGVGCAKGSLAFLSEPGKQEGVDGCYFISIFSGKSGNF